MKTTNYSNLLINYLNPTIASIAYIPSESDAPDFSDIAEVENLHFCTKVYHNHEPCESPSNVWRANSVHTITPYHLDRVLGYILVLPKSPLQCVFVESPSECSVRQEEY